MYVIFCHEHHFSFISMLKRPSEACSRAVQPGLQGLKTARTAVGQHGTRIGRGESRVQHKG
jgi:hypothetical protein